MYLNKFHREFSSYSQTDRWQEVIKVKRNFELKKILMRKCYSLSNRKESNPVLTEFNY